MINANVFQLSNVVKLESVVYGNQNQKNNSYSIGSLFHGVIDRYSSKSQAAQVGRDYWGDNQGAEVVTIYLNENENNKAADNVLNAGDGYDGIHTNVSPVIGLF